MSRLLWSFPDTHFSKLTSPAYPQQPAQPYYNPQGQRPPPAMPYQSRAYVPPPAAPQPARLTQSTTTTTVVVIR